MLLKTSAAQESHNETVGHKRKLKSCFLKAAWRNPFRDDRLGYLLIFVSS